MVKLNQSGSCNGWCAFAFTSSAIASSAIAFGVSAFASGASTRYRMYDLQTCIAKMQESQSDMNSPDLLETTSCQGRRLLNTLTEVMHKADNVLYSKTIG
jgi:hypothetical protein